jgi:hypothetical protein
MLSKMLKTKHGNNVANVAHQWFVNGIRNANTEDAGEALFPICHARSRQQGVRSTPPQSERQMLRIEKDCDGRVTRLRLSGRIQSGLITSIRSAMDDGCARKILDLSEVTLVDLGVVRFLISCENDGVELVECPPYVREWIFRQRAEGVQPGPSDGG